MGYDMHEGTVVRWLKSEGSEVNMGEPVAEIETDKAVVEFESYASGVLHKILVPEGTIVPVGQPIAVVGEPGEELPELVVEVAAPGEELTEAVVDVAASGEELPEPVVEAAAPGEELPKSAVEAAAPAPEAPARRDGAPPASPGEIRASPVARRLANERGIDLSQVEGTGPGGRVTKDDVLGFTGAPSTAVTAAPPAPAVAEAAPGETIPLSRMRQQIARVTVRSKQEKPHFYLSSEIDMTRAMDLRQQINQVVEDEGVRVSVNDLIIKACVESLKRYPKFNAFFEEDGIRMNREINIGVAIAQEEGLIVPAIMDCASKSLKDIAVASKDLADRAGSGALHPQEYTGGTFAISNLGMFDVTSFMAIIHPPQTAVLAVGAVAKRPVVREDKIVVAQVMTATLSGDHRIVDGAEGALFINEVKRLLENPIGLWV